MKIPRARLGCRLPRPNTFLPANRAFPRTAARWALAWVFATAAGQGWAALAVNSIDVPSRIGRGQAVPVVVQVTRVSGAGPELVTVQTPAELAVVTPLPAGCTLAGSEGAAQTVSCSNVDPVGAGAITTLSLEVRGRALGGGNVTASTAGPPPSLASDSFSVVSGADLTVTKAIAPAATAATPAHSKTAPGSSATSSPSSAPRSAPA